VQIVHDLKNQLNGLKLYATFLRKRMEKSERPEDEQETILKLIAGLERAASDMTTLVRYSRPVELRRQPGVSLSKLLAEATQGDGLYEVRSQETGAELYQGEFDVAALTEAFKAIHTGALALSRNGQAHAHELHIRLDESESADPAAIIEWRGVKTDSDPFRSFAGSDALRMSLAAKIIEAHGGEATYADGALRVRLPLSK
jgi:signal transduction histidine kinase